MTYIAFGNKAKKEIRVYSRYSGVNDDGSIHFYCINGEWPGTWKDRVLFESTYKCYFQDVDICWIGNLPKELRNEADYNEAMEYIRNLVDWDYDYPLETSPENRDGFWSEIETDEIPF